MADDFAQALIDGRPPKYAPSDGVANMAVIDRLYESAGR
jgi:predicted dehydrogenase